MSLVHAQLNGNGEGTTGRRKGFGPDKSHKVMRRGRQKFLLFYE